MNRDTANLALAFWFATCALLSGCAVPGDPSARHPVVPATVADLAGRQSGSEVVLTFTLPTQSADHTDLAEPQTIEIYRYALPTGATADRKSPWRLTYTLPAARIDAYTQAGRISFHDPLTPDLFASAPGSILAYMVRTRISNARASDDSNIFTAHLHAPPEAPRDVRVSVSKTALVVNWSESPEPPGASQIGYRIYRGEMDSAQESPPQDASQAKLKSPMTLIGSSTSSTFSDLHFEFGKTYLYDVRSAAQFGGDSVESVDSPPVAVVPRDTFPPAQPQGLEISIVPATPQAPSYVELSWAISSEEDLAGYNIYRSDSEDVPGERANGEMLLPSPTFRDISVVPGGRYFYRVSAVDLAGNESPKSSAVQTQVPLSGQ